MYGLKSLSEKQGKSQSSRSTTLRFGRDDNFVMRFTDILEGKNPTFLQQNCHPDRSAA
jgi:hypothetical protein